MLARLWLQQNHADTTALPSLQQSGLPEGLLPMPTRALPPFRLTDSTGAIWDNKRLEGHYTLIFFGYTRCPDVCPQTLGLLAAMDRSLEEQRQKHRPQVLFVSIDPEHDQGAGLGDYVHYFSAAFAAATAPQEQLRPLVRAMDAMFIKEDDGSFTHSASAFLIDTKGRLIARLTPPFDPRATAAMLGPWLDRLAKRSS
jgi:protein SCO1/2